MRYYTFVVDTAVGRVERIGAELDGRLVDLTAAAGFAFREAGEPDAGEYAAFLVPPDMVGFLSRGDKAGHAVAESLALLRTAACTTSGS